MGRTDVASRVIAAPPDAVYDALVEPDALKTWLPPEGMIATFERFDARPGGSYRMILRYADAADAPGKTTAEPIGTVATLSCGSQPQRPESSTRSNQSPSLPRRVPATAARSPTVNG